MDAALPPLAAVTFYQTELGRGVPVLPGEPGPSIDEAACWREIVAEDQGRDAVEALARAYGRHSDYVAADWDRYLVLLGAYHHLAATLLDRLRGYDAFLQARYQEHPDCRTLGMLRAVGAFDGYTLEDMGLPYLGSEAVADQVPAELAEALCLRRWLAEHPPTVNVAQP
jgi:hypothetical protein